MLEKFHALKGKIWKYLHDFSLTLLLTRRFNQDYLENAFFFIHGQGGFHDNLNLQ